MANIASNRRAKNTISDDQSIHMDSSYRNIKAKVKGKLYLI